MPYPEPGNPLGALIRTALEDAGLSVAEGARRVGVTRSTLHGYIVKPTLRLEPERREALMELDLQSRQIELAAAQAAGYKIERLPQDVLSTALEMTRLDEFDRRELWFDVRRRREIAGRVSKSRAARRRQR
jgi:transcriptional regulator with XRE-family HTH domain